MKKKAYISPETEVVRIKIEHLLVDVSGEGIQSDPNSDTTTGVDNRSRRRRDVWDEEEEDF